MKTLLATLLLLVSFSATADTKQDLMDKLVTLRVASGGCALYIEVHNAITDPDCYRALWLMPEFGDILHGLKESDLSTTELADVLHSANRANQNMDRLRDAIGVIAD